MADMNETTPEIVIEPEAKPNTFTQEDVSRLVSKNVKEERAKIFKVLGVEDNEEAPKNLTAYKEWQDKQKSDYDKIVETNKMLETENATVKAQLKAIDTEKKLTKVLTDMQIDGNYHKAITKLISEVPEDEKELKELITSTIKEFLPGAIETKDVGFEKKADKKIIGGSKQLLDEKYKNNPFYKG